jgi:glutaredoxin
MGFIALCLLGIGVLASLIGWVLLLVAAFRQHVGWGVASLFVPAASLVFTVLHWAEARRGFLIQLMGLLVLSVGVLAANDAGAGGSLRAHAQPAADENGEAALRAKESEVQFAEKEFAALQAKLATDYTTLKSRREALGSDPAAIAEFNEEAAAYAAEKTALSIQAGRLAQLRADQVRMTDRVFLEARERARKSPSAVPALASPVEAARASASKPVSVSRGDVVMYTTKRCPACVAAKQYFARQGVPYREVDVESDREGRAEFSKLGGNAVPLIIVKGQRMVGFNQRELEKLL